MARTQPRSRLKHQESAVVNPEHVEPQASAFDARQTFDEAVTRVYVSYLAAMGFANVAKADEALFSSRLFCNGPIFVGFSIDWREGDIEARIGFNSGAMDHPRKIESIWDLEHHALIELYARRVVPTVWAEHGEELISTERSAQRALSEGRIKSRLDSLGRLLCSLLASDTVSAETVSKAAGLTPN
jgi:hypothetical protein